MDMQSRKYRLIEKLMQVNEEETLYRLEQALQESQAKSNLWDALPDEAKKAVEESILQSKAGKTVPAGDIIARIKSHYIG